MFNYDNIGKKIKRLAKYTCYAGIIIALSLGIALLFSPVTRIKIIGGLVIVFLPILAWVQSWLVYGFGELVDAALIYRKLMSTTVSEQSESLPKKAHGAGFNKETEDTFWRSALGGKELVCKRCGKPIAYEHDFK